MGECERLFQEQLCTLDGLCGWAKLLHTNLTRWPNDDGLMSVFRLAVGTSTRLKKDLSPQLWYMGPDRSTIHPEIVLNNQEFPPSNRYKKRNDMFFVLETVALQSMPVFVFIAQSLCGLSVCASSWIWTRACWSKGQLCGSRRPDMLPVAGPIGRESLVLSTAHFLWPRFQFQHSYWGRSRSVCWSIKNKREWMELRVLHNRE